VGEKRGERERERERETERVRDRDIMGRETGHGLRNTEREYLN